MGMECGRVYSVTVIWANGKILKHTVMVFISGKMATGTKAAGTIASSTERVPIFLQTVIPIREIILMESQTVRVFTNGRTGAYTRVTSKTG